MGGRIVLLPGDGIGPEVTAAARQVLDASGADLDWDVHQVGMAALAAGSDVALPARALDSIGECRIALKGPLSTPDDGSMPSPTMALRQELDLHSQVRHALRFSGVPGCHDHVDVVVIRQTTEDTYAGIEFAAGTEAGVELVDWLRRRGKPVPARSGLALKVVSEAATRRTFEFAADYARRNGRQRVTAGHKSTMLPRTDGLFVALGREVLADHPTLRFDTIAIDLLAAELVQRPERFDVLVLPSQYGDIMADLAGALVGGIGMVPGGNFGGERRGGVAIFEPAHGSAPRQAGRDRANPCATILSGALALRHLGEHAAADRVWDAVRAALADGIHTYDLEPGRLGERSVGTAGFAAAVIERI